MNTEYENKNKSGQSQVYQPGELSLKEYYAIAALSVTIGIVVIGILNLVTPLQIIIDRLDFVSRFSGPFLLLLFIPQILLLMRVYISSLIVVWIIPRSISRFLNIFTRDGFYLQDDVTLIVFKVGKA